MKKARIQTFLVALAAAILLVSLPASAQMWGNFPDTDWLTFETDHFRIHYYPETEWTARMLAKYAEISYPKVTGMFNYPLKEKVHIVVRDQEENANGFAVYGADWVTVWATPLYYVLRGRQEWVPDCFTHEFSHIVSLKVDDWKSESSIVLFGMGLIEDGVNNIDYGASFLVGVTHPYWWTEGIAEYGAHMAGFNWWTTSRDMHLRQAMLEDNYLTFDEMFSPGNKDTSFDREKGYQQGYSMALYVMEKFGREQYAQLAMNSGEQGHLVWEKNIEDVLGIDGQTLYDGYVNWMKSRYERQIAPIRNEEHHGPKLFTTTPMEEVDILEKLSDGRVKVELGKPKLELALPYNVEEAEDTIDMAEDFLKAQQQKPDEKMASLVDPATKAVALLKAAVSQYKAANVDDDTKPREKAAIYQGFQAKQFGYDKAGLPDAAEMKKLTASEPAKALAQLTLKQIKPKIKYWDKRTRKAFFEKGGGAWDMVPRYSPDGKWTTYAGRKGVTLLPMNPDQWPVFTGTYLSPAHDEALGEDMESISGSSVFTGYDFSPDSKKVLFSSLSCPNTWLPCIHLDGYYRYDLYEYDIETQDVEKLSNKLRAVYPSYSPDGKTIAFIHIEDGQNWLGTIPAEAREVAIDGSCTINGQERKDCIHWLIKKHDGTQLGQPSWSQDSGRIVLDLYRNNQQDIWMLNADGSNLTPLTWDRAEDRDGRFTPDGEHILYSSDRTGIFNVYMMNLKTREVKQLTNVTGGAFTPVITPDGNLMYSYFRSYGLDIRGLKKADFFNKVIEAGYDVEPQEVARNLAYQEPLPEIRDKSDAYNPFNPEEWQPVEGIPLFIYERNSMSIGAYLGLSDYLDKHRLGSQVMLGQTSDIRLFYVNNFWYPTFSLGYVHVDFGGYFSQGFTSSDQVASRVEPHFDQPLKYKYSQSVDFGFAGMELPLTDALKAGFNYLYRYYTSQGRSDAKNDAFLTNNSYYFSLEFEAMGYGPENDINPVGRKLTFDYGFVRTGMPLPQFADVEWLGRHNPPGDHSDDYSFHELQFSYTEAIPVSWWNPGGKHTLQLHMRAGWQDRNVFRWDEHFAGSMHPLRYVPTQSTSYEFAGYEDFSLSGETMLILSMAYRFPIYRHIDRKVGPFIFASVWGEIFGTAGNLWGYTGEYVTDPYGNVRRNPDSYWDPYIKRGTVRREIPFQDIARSNGNYMLYDIGFALKVKGFLFSYIPWNSFFRVAYGLNEVLGRNETNDDNVYVDNYPNDAAYAESEPKSLRIAIGLGSNFD